MIDKKTSDKINKNILWSKIKTVGTFYGEDYESLKEYAKDVYSANLGDLNRAIECFQSLSEQIEVIKHANE